MNDNIKSLWNTLRDSGYNPPAIEEFAKDMQNEDNLKGVHATLKSEGYTPPELNAFKKDMGWHKMYVGGKETYFNDADYNDFMRRHPSGRTNNKPQAAQKPAAAPKPIQLPEGFGQPASMEAGLPAFMQEQVRKQREASYGTKEQQQAINDTKAALNGDEKAEERVGLKRMSQQLRDRADYFAATGKELKFEGVDMTQLGAAPTVARDGQGEMVMGKNGAPIVGMTNDEVRVDTQKVEQERIRQADLQRQIDEAQQEADAIRKQIRDIETPDYIYQQDALSPYADPRVSNDKLSALSAAYKQAQERIKALQVEKAGGEHGFFNGLFTTAKDPSTWLLGLDKIGDSVEMLYVSEKLKKGIELTDEEKQMLGQTLKNQEVQSRLSEDSDFMYRAGAMTTQMVPFAWQIALTGGFGAVAAVGENVGKKLAVDYAAKFGEKALMHRINANIIKAVGIGMGDIAAGFVSANTLGLANTANDAVERRIGQLTMNEDGDYAFEGGEDWLDAIFKAEVSQTKEFATERFGEHLPGLREMNVWFAKRGATARKIARGLSGFAGTKAMQKTAAFLRKGGINGVGSEILEEEIGLPVDVAIGDMTWEEALGAKNQWDITGGMLLSMGAMHAIGATAQGLGKTYNTAQYYRYKRRVDKASSIASYRMTSDKWTPLKAEIDGTKTENMNDLWERVREDESMEPIEKRAVFDYMNAITLERGYNMGMFFSAHEAAKRPELALNMKPTTEEEQMAADVMGSRDAGYNLTEGQDMNDAKNNYEYQQSQLEAQFGGLAEIIRQQLDSNPAKTLADMRDNDRFTDEQRQTALDYANARVTYEGMIDRVRDDIDAQMQESDRRVGERVSRTDGMIHPATMKMGDRQVYIVDGNVSMTDDGAMVDVSNSSESILVRDAETGKLEFASPHDILSVDAAIDADEVMQQARQAIQETYAQEQADKIDGVLPFNENDTYGIVDEQGQPHEVTILANNGDGTVMVAIDGQQIETPVTTESIQEMADNANLARLQQHEAEKVAQRADYEGYVPEYEGGREAGSDYEGYVPDAGNAAAEPQRADYEGYVPEYEGGKPADNAVEDNSAAYAAQADTYDKGAEGDFTPMPMNGEEPDFMAVTPQRAYAYLYGESGLSEEDATAFLNNNKSAADKELEKIKGKKPKMGTSIAKFNKDNAEWQKRVDDAQATADYWNAVKAERDKTMAQRNAERAEVQRIATEKAQAEQAAYEAEQKRKAEEAAQLGSNNVAPAIVEKWQNAKKVEGAKDEIVLPNGEKISGHYVLVESGAATPSHDSTNGFAPTEGFPVDENGNSVNDRDYENDKDTQQVTRDIASHYDSRGVQTPVVVSQDGVVLSGNGRTMAGELAASQNTDGAYNDYVRGHAGKWGFTESEVDGMEHPRVVFVPDAAMPYTAETFAKFNQQEMKSQSKTEQAVKLGKVVSDGAFNRIIRLINGFDKLGDFYADSKATAEAIADLQKDGVITQVQMAELFDGESLSAAGKELLENMLIGKAFESNPDAVREISEIKSMRQSIIMALAEISNNLALGDYSLESELAQAIDLVYAARKAGSKAGDRVSWYARQQNLFSFELGDTVADYTNSTMLMLADVINDNKPSRLKNFMQIYNAHAQDSANGQMDLFAGSVKSKEQIINEVKQLIYNGTEAEQQEAARDAIEKRKADSVQQDGIGSDSTESGNELEDPDFGTIFNQFEGRANEAIAFLLVKQNGVAKKALHHPEVGDIDIWYGSDKAGLKKIAKKHPEVLYQLQDILNSMRIVQESDNRIKLESDTHFIVISKDWLGKEKDNWLLTAYEKKEKGSSGGSMDIVPEPEGKQNGTAPLQTSLPSAGKVTDNYSTVQENQQKNADNGGNTQENEPKSAIAQAEAEVEQNPTDAQKEAGNYKKGHVKVDGYDITIENPKGSVRSGKDKDGKEWSVTMNNTYGYIRGTEGVDGDHIDVFLSDNPEQGNMVYVIDQVKQDGTFDEHKVMYGFNSLEEAEKAYLANYSPGWKGLGALSEVSKENFKKWIESSHRKTKPYKDYRGVDTFVSFGRGIKKAVEETVATDAESEEERIRKENLNVGDRIIYNGKMYAIARINTDFGDRRYEIQTSRDGMQVVKPSEITPAFVFHREDLFVAEEPVADNAATPGAAEQDAVPSGEAEGTVAKEQKSAKGKVKKAKTKKSAKEADAEAKQKDKSMATTEGVNRKLKGLSDEENEALVALKKQMAELLKGGGMMYSSIVPIDPKAPQKIAVGTQIAFLYIKSGIRQFADFCDNLISDMGDQIRPYLKSIYNAVRDYPGAEEYADDMTSYDEVRAFDVMEYDRETVSTDPIQKAEEIVAEEEVNKEVATIQKQVIEPATANVPRQLDLFGDVVETPAANSTKTTTKTAAQGATARDDVESERKRKELHEKRRAELSKTAKAWGVEKVLTGHEEGTRKRFDAKRAWDWLLDNAPAEFADNMRGCATISGGSGFTFSTEHGKWDTDVASVKTYVVYGESMMMIEFGKPYLGYNKDVVKRTKEWIKSHPTAGIYVTNSTEVYPDFAFETPYEFWDFFRYVYPNFNVRPTDAENYDFENGPGVKYADVYKQMLYNGDKEVQIGKRIYHCDYDPLTDAYRCWSYPGADDDNGLHAFDVKAKRVEGSSTIGTGFDAATQAKAYNIPYKSGAIIVTFDDEGKEIREVAAKVTASRKGESVMPTEEKPSNSLQSGKKDVSLQWQLNHAKDGSITIQAYTEVEGGGPVFDARRVYRFKNAQDALDTLSNPANKLDALLKQFEQTLKNIAETDAAEVAAGKPQNTVNEAKRAFVQRVGDMLAEAVANRREGRDERPFKSIIDLRKLAQKVGMNVDMNGRDDILLQELVEDALVATGRRLLAQPLNEGETKRAYFERILDLYAMQPTIAARSSNRIAMQQYSTPLPMAYVADLFILGGDPKRNLGKVLEPTAGNGMLVFGINPKSVHANELDETRLDNLKGQGFAKVTQQDAMQMFDGGKQYDAVVANPPFGSAPGKMYDGKVISGLDPLITINALESMSDYGRAAIIIGGNMQYASNGSVNDHKAFWTYLYDHYNVKGVIDMDGELYAKQGTKYPTRMILIDGRRTSAERQQSTVYPPVEGKGQRKAMNYVDLYNTLTHILNNNEKTDGTEIIRGEDGGTKSQPNDTRRTADKTGRGEQSRKSNETLERGGDGLGNGSQRTLVPEKRSDNTPADGRRAGGRKGDESPSNGNDGRSGLLREQGNNAPERSRIGRDSGTTDRGTAGRAGESGRVDSTNNNNGASTVRGTTLLNKEVKRELNTEKLPYRQHNTAFSLQSVAPASMVEAMDRTLSRIEEQYGNIDEWVTKELGYDSIDDMHSALAGEQVDSVAMAIAQMKKGQGFIIGDQTGVGKGRQMAALIRWACKQGKQPVFFTQKADLFTDIYRDLVDVGSGDLKPFIVNADGAMLDANGKTVHKPLSSAAQKKIFESGELPSEYNFVVVTYSQVNTGDAVSKEEYVKQAKENKQRVSKKDKEGPSRPTPKATWIRAMVEDSYLFMDESHTGAGQSNTGYYMQSISKNAKAVTYASATFAKRPDTMPLYAMRTAMAEANIPTKDLISIIEKGGVTLQEIMSRALTEAGQMVRRERDMSDVKTDWKTITDAETVRKARENYDKTIKAFNAIIDFQNRYVKPMIELRDAQLAVVASTANVKKGTNKLGIENVPFASKTYNYTKQLMLALKTQAIIDEVEAEIKAGRHPVIALESTMEAAFKEYAGNELEEATFAASLLRGLDTVMQYTETDEDGNEQHGRYSPAELGEEGEKAYYALQDFIRESTSDIFISPLDEIIEGLRERGYKVGELTGRNTYVERTADGKAFVRKRTDKDKKRMQREFNNGTLDVLILNKSASTGISLHASSRFADQRQRSMVIAQPLSDINDYMQMIGRIDRTGQVSRGYYINLGLPVPAENRFLMMLSTKLKSLNANTTTAQESSSNDVEAPDLLNKYGSRVVIEYLRDHTDIYEKMGMPLKGADDPIQPQQLEDYKPGEDDARKITGYVALLSTNEQEEFYNDVVERYNALIKYLDDTGSNDLKITVMPLKAKTLEKAVSSEGVDPNGDNPFAQNAYVEKVEMDVLRKPMKASEVEKVISNINGGEDATERTKHLQSLAAENHNKHVEEENARYERTKEKNAKAVEEFTARVNAQEKASADEKAKAISDKREDLEGKSKEAHEERLRKIEQKDNQYNHALEMFTVGQTYLMPDDPYQFTFSSSSPAIFCGYKAKEDKMTPSTTMAVFAVLDGRRRLEFKLTDMMPLQNIKTVTMQNYDAAHGTSLNNWDEQIPNEARTTGYILTGNILQAVKDSQREDGSYPGQLISYTDIDGNIHDGVLMPEKWEPSQLRNSGVPVLARLADIKSLRQGQSIKSSNGEVEIRGDWGGAITIVVPKSTSAGGKYFKNEELLKLVDGRVFYQRNGKFNGDVPSRNIDEAIRVLSNLGVRVEGKKDTSGKPMRTDDLYRMPTEFEDGQKLAVKRNGDEYSVDGLNATYATKERLLDAFREKYDAYVAMLADDGNSIVVEPWSKYLKPKKGKSAATAPGAAGLNRGERRAVAMIEETAKKLGLDVEVRTDTEGLEGRQAKAKGWYDRKTGRIVIVLPNHTSGGDVMRTLLHEGVAHHGLRELFGEDFDTFLDNVFQNVGEETRSEIVKIAAKMGWDFRTATEEYLASMAEDMNFEHAMMQGWWGKVREAFLKLLRTVGLNLDNALTDNELRYVLWRSYDNLKNGNHHGVLRMAEDVVMQERLGVGNYAPAEIGSERVAEGDLLYRDGEDEEEERPLSLKESIIQGLMKLAQKHKDNMRFKMDVARAIGGHLAELSKVMSSQKEYDRSTVDQLVGIARLMIKNDKHADLNNRELRGLLTAISQATGKKDIRTYANQIADILIGNQLGQAKQMLMRLVNMRGSKVNAQGVEVQGELDADGQLLMKTFREAKDMERKAIIDRMSVVSDAMGSADDAIAHEASVEYSALQLALSYNEDVKSLEDEEKTLKADLDDAKRQHKEGLPLKAYQELTDSINESIRQNMLDRVEALNMFTQKLAGVMRGSIESAQAFREREKARVDKIHHFANSDMLGKPANEHIKESWKQIVMNFPLIRFFTNSLQTFATSLRMLGSKSARGEGYLYNHFMRGWTDCTDTEYRNFKAACDILDKKVSEVFGKEMRWSDLYTEERKRKPVTVSFWDGGEMRDHELTQGNLLYIYMVNKMADGRMKLRKMGITEEEIEYLTDLIDPRFIQLADWLQSEFLVQKRNDYNAVHLRMFGAPMAAIDNYFPLRILGNAREQPVDVSEADIEKDLSSLLTGSIIKRKRNALALDVTGADAFSVVIEHLQEMERWAAFAEWKRDLNTLLSYKKFRNRILNMSSIYGSGKVLWRNIMVCGSIAAGTHRPKVGIDALDTTIVNVAKGVTRAKIAFRIFTAFKQLASAPAFLSDANLVNLTKSFATPWVSWNWAMENLPTFRKRWESKQAGDTRLMPTDADWRFWQNKLVDTLSRWGMTPNAFVDALTVAIGGKAIYDTKYAQYIDYGYSKEEADKRARQDAAISVNETQQSSENAFVSKMQVDRTVASLAFSVFRNASFAYARRLVNAIRTLKRMMNPKYWGESTAFMTKQMVRDGLSEEKASRAAKKIFARAGITALIDTAVFGYIMSYAWDLIAYLPYLLLGDDDDEKEKMQEDAAQHGLFGPVEGLTGGSLISEVGNMYMNGEDLRNHNFNLLPLASDMQTIMNHYDKDKVQAANDVVNLLVQSGIGVNPQTITDAAVAIWDACDGDPETSREAAILFLRLTSSPQSQIDKLMIDEVGMTGEEARKLTVRELADRYARYKLMRDAPLTMGLYDDEMLESKTASYYNRFTDMVRERDMMSSGDDAVDDAYEQYAETAKLVGKREQRIKDRYSTDAEQLRVHLSELTSTQEYRDYRYFDRAKRNIDKYERLALSAESAEKRKEYLDKIADLKKTVVGKLNEMHGIGEQEK